MLNNQTENIFSWISMEVIFHPISTDRISNLYFFDDVQEKYYLMVRLFFIKRRCNYLEMWKNATGKE